MVDVEAVEYGNVVPVVLCGGNGTRLWPLSRKALPKQFMEISPGRTFLGDTLLRTKTMKVRKYMVVCNEAHRFMAAKIMQEHDCIGDILLEPQGRNTAPAVTCAALNAEESDILLVLPADHDLRDSAVFADAVKKGMQAAAAGNLVCFGIVPERPETGYGYMRAGAKNDVGFDVDCFVEKPDLKKAREYCDAGDYYWNSGMFMFRADVFLQEMAEHAPEILATCTDAVDTAVEDLDFMRLSPEVFLKCPSDSIDYAVMEKTANICMVPLDTPWTDMGSWNAFHDFSQQDERGNGSVGDVFLSDVDNSYVHSSKRLVSVLGVRDLVVVETADAVMVSSKEQVQSVGGIVKALTDMGRREASQHQVEYRPWGSFESLVVGDRFQVKRITVKPGEVLSLQMHHHRAEHWVVVRGMALIVNGEEQMLLHEDQSTYIPVGQVHRLENPGKIPLEIIEIQTGSYLGEDDIVRLEDKYRR